MRQLVTCSMIQVSSPKRILHIDQHPVAHLGLKRIVERLPRVETLYLSDPRRYQAQSHPLDLIVLEIVTTPPVGVATIRQLAAKKREIPILILSSSDETIYADRCLKAGARGYLMKTAKPDEFLSAIETIWDGGLWVSERVKALMVDRLANPSLHPESTGFHKLSDRELLIVEQIALSKNNKEIAQALQISIKTIESHRSRIKSKLRLDTPQDLMRYALRIHGI